METIDFKDDLLFPIEPDYLSPKISLPYRLHRQDRMVGGEESRFYLQIHRNESGEVMTIERFKSVTSVASATIPKGAGYYKWLQTKGPMADYERLQAATFGTIFHKEALRPLLRKRHPVHGLGYNWDWYGQTSKILNPLTNAEEDNPLGWSNFDMMFPPEMRGQSPAWLKLFKTCLASWAQWVKEKVIEVIGVEVPLRSFKYDMAGMGDLFHVSKFYGKDRICYTDIKTALYTLLYDKKKEYYEANHFQAAAMTDLWNENFPDFPCTHAFMWSPVKFKGDTPTFQWDNMTSTQYFQEVKGKSMYNHHMEYHSLKGTFVPKMKVLDIQGVTEDIYSFNFAKNIRRYEF